MASKKKPKAITLTLRLAEVLEEEGVTKSDFAIMIGARRQTVSYYLKGDSSPALDTISRMANARDIHWVRLIKEG